MKGGFINPPNQCNRLQLRWLTLRRFNEGRVYKPAEPPAHKPKIAAIASFNEGRVYKPAERIHNSEDNTCIIQLQ